MYATRRGRKTKKVNYSVKQKTIIGPRKPVKYENEIFEPALKTPLKLQFDAGYAPQIEENCEEILEIQELYANRNGLWVLGKTLDGDYRQKTKWLALKQQNSILPKIK